MPNPKGHPETLIPGQGRPKGCPNKFTTLKQAFLNAFNGIGGEEALKEWAGNPRNMRDFLTLIARMLPTHGELDVKHEPLVIIRPGVQKELAEPPKQITNGETGDAKFEGSGNAKDTNSVSG